MDEAVTDFTQFANRFAEYLTPVKRQVGIDIRWRPGARSGIGWFGRALGDDLRDVIDEAASRPGDGEEITPAGTRSGGSP